MPTSRDIAARPVAPRQPRADRADAQIIKQQPAELSPHLVRQRRADRALRRTSASALVGLCASARVAHLHRLEQVATACRIWRSRSPSPARNSSGLLATISEPSRTRMSVDGCVLHRARAPRSQSLSMSGVRRAGRRQQADPRRRLVARHAGFRDRRHIRQRRRALRAADRERAQRCRRGYAG